MSNPACRSNQEPAFSASTQSGCTKMAAAADTGTQPRVSLMDGQLEYRQVLSQPTYTSPLGPHGLTQQDMIPSPASTESLLNHTFGEQAFSPAGPTMPDYTVSPLHEAPAQNPPFNV